MSASIKSLAIQEWISRLLSDGPLSASEISERMFEETWEAWAEDHGYGGLIEWRTDAEPFGARLLAFYEAKDRGLAPLHSWQLRSHLQRMERDSLVYRLELPGHRPMLWAATNDGEDAQAAKETGAP